jgi:hypothetical protein
VEQRFAKDVVVHRFEQLYRETRLRGG